MLNHLSDRRALFAVSGAVVIAVLIAAAMSYRSSNERYFLTTTASGVSYKIDRRTGKTWQIYGTTIQEVDELKAAAPEPKVVEVPREVLSQIQGRGGYSVGSLFSGSLYNGSDWRIRRIRLLIWSKPVDNETPWSRHFVDNVFLEPEASGSFQVDTTDGNLNKATDWNLVSAWGFKK